MTELFPKLFSPLRVGSYTLKNRIMNTGHAAHFQAGDGTPTEQYVHYVGERAKGGAAIIVTGHTLPVYDGEASLSLTNFDERVNPVLQRMAAASHWPSKFWSGSRRPPPSISTLHRRRVPQRHSGR